MQWLLIGCFIGFLPLEAMAYVSPGLGAGVVGTVFGILGAVALALFAILYYPIKRALRRKRGKATADDSSA